jgi:hypothetical protein
MAAEPGPEQGYGYAQTATERVAKESAVLSGISKLHTELDRLDSQIGRIRGKLEPIMRMTPEGDTMSPLQEAAGSEVAREIHRAARRAYEATEIIIATYDQLEL